jgi:HEAT repeat protein
MPVRVAAIVALRAVGAPAVAAIVSALRDEGDFVASAAVDALVALGEPAVPPLLEALGAEDPRLCVRAAEILGGMARRAVIYPLPVGTALSQGLRHPDPAVRMGAAHALGQAGWGEALVLRTLAAALRDPFWGARHAAAVALGQMRAEKALPHLLEALQDPFFGVQLAAIEALHQIGDPRARPALEQLLEQLTAREESEAEVLAKAARAALTHLASPASAG